MKTTIELTQIYVPGAKGYELMPEIAFDEFEGPGHPSPEEIFDGCWVDMGIGYQTRHWRVDGDHIIPLTDQARRWLDSPDIPTYIRELVEGGYKEGGLNGKKGMNLEEGKDAMMRVLELLHEIVPTDFQDAIRIAGMSTVDMFYKAYFHLDEEAGRRAWAEFSMHLWNNRRSFFL